jgi:hypothetical protein
LAGHRGRPLRGRRRGRAAAGRAAGVTVDWVVDVLRAAPGRLRGGDRGLPSVTR